MVLFGILAYSALSHLVGDAIYFVEGGRSLLEFGCSLGLGVLYGMTARRVWFDSNTPWWIIVAPAVLSLMISCVHSPSGMTLTVPLALSVVLLITTLIRIKLHQAFGSVLQDD
ncbi:hypothetical protein GCM10007901_06590 [Dyella acidisoli]|uniref:Uncharacterized protein n=2 Tax=Dyella acidisoli TaxID=1867834 RepID=A0ABQ5XJ37_9GAMM|nr:hypothetical protein GCM10007901_06590 [Dyella acidisoli]